jgi:hypothetical protein
VAASGAHEKELFGGEPLTTNNRMELTAVIEALAALKRPQPVVVYTDSEYVKNGITTWIHGWKARGWLTADRKPVKNVELWQRLDALRAAPRALALGQGPRRRPRQRARRRAGQPRRGLGEAGLRRPSRRRRFMGRTARAGWRIHSIRFCPPRLARMALKKMHTLVAVVGLAADRRQAPGGGRTSDRRRFDRAPGASCWRGHGGGRRTPGGLGAGTAGGGARAPGAGARRRATRRRALAGRWPGGGGGGKVEAVTLTDDVQAVGSLRSRQGVMLRPEVSGRIAQLGFTDGGRVQRGQLLVQLDDTLQRRSCSRPRRRPASRAPTCSAAASCWRRGFVSQSAVDQNAAALQVAEAQVALARRSWRACGAGALRRHRSASSRSRGRLRQGRRRHRQPRRPVAMSVSSACPSATPAACAPASRWR